ncbi:MAG: nucleotidyltransferase domain-containing protein [Magnetococcales bacterium]|nr:nucleotidyltransferase domain-containing protein [Magnetococcales bacterium]
MVDLAASHLHEVRRILRAWVPECEVWAHGSRVTGRAVTWSDLDLVLLDPSNRLTWRDVERVKEAFACSDLPIMVDVCDWAGIGDELREVIQGCHEVIQVPGKEAP